MNKRLIINKLRFHVSTIAKNTYGATVVFEPKGLNIIWGPNSVGKTSIITGIIYGLGAEKGLGIFSSSQNPFKPEFREKINNEEIQQSCLFLDISNGERTISIFRYIKGGDIDIVAIKEDNETEYSKRFIVNGEGVFSESGFQTYLFEFLGFSKVSVPTYEDKEARLYFENILPLFFVEQRAGWSQIQARQVTRFGIRDVKKISFEYLMGLDKFKKHIEELYKKMKEAELKEYKRKLTDRENNIFIESNGEKKDNKLFVLTKEQGQIFIDDYISYLKSKYECNSKNINKITSLNDGYEEENKQLRSQIGVLEIQLRKIKSKIDQTNIEIQGYNTYLDRIRTNKYKNKQLKKLLEIPVEFNISMCPVCGLPIDSEKEEENDCILCHRHPTKKKVISTPDENLLFLEDEESTFIKAINQKEFDKQKFIVEKERIKSILYERQEQLTHQTKTYAGADFEKMRIQILKVDSLYKEYDRYRKIKEKWDNLDKEGALRKIISTLEEEISGYTEKISTYEQSEEDKKIEEVIKKHIKNNLNLLGLFKHDKKLISRILINEKDDYGPFLLDQDIYNISSSSDNIRIIFCYYLALLQTSMELKTQTNILFPNILILDEPKQQNLDGESLNSGIRIIENMNPNEYQAILTTYSENPTDYKYLKKYITYEMKNSDDYLLKKIK